MIKKADRVAVVSMKGFLLSLLRSPSSLSLPIHIYIIIIILFLLFSIVLNSDNRQFINYLCECKFYTSLVKKQIHIQIDIQRINIKSLSVLLIETVQANVLLRFLLFGLCEKSNNLIKAIIKLRS